RAWLADHDDAGNPLGNRTGPNALFVYSSWLDAVTGGGKTPLEKSDRELVEAPIRAWLADRDDAGNRLRNRTNPNAGFVYKSWLDAVTGGGKTPLEKSDRGLVDEPIRAWLADRDQSGNHLVNRINSDAPFLYESWLNAAKSG